MEEYENPFDFIKSNKEFIQQLEVNRDVYDQKIKLNSVQNQNWFDNLHYNNEKAEKYGLIKRLYQPKFDEADLDQVFKQKKKTNEIFKEKKETLKEFIIKKRKIFTTNMNMNIKKDETVKLDELVRNEEESLKARELDCQKDNQLIKEFINDVKKQADFAQQITEEEVHKKERLQMRINILLNEIEKEKQTRERDLEQIQLLQIYKKFIDQIWGKFRIQNSNNHGNNNEMFLTIQQTDNVKTNNYLEENDEFVIPFQDTKQVPEFLNMMEDKNLINIQNQSKDQDELDKVKKEFEKLKSELESIKKDFTLKIDELQKQLDFLYRKNQKLQQLKVFDGNQIEMNDGEVINMNTICNKVKEIYYEIQDIKSNKNVANETQQNRKNTSILSSGIIKFLTEIEEYIMSLQKKYEFWKKDSYINNNFLIDAESKLKKRNNEKKKDKELKEQNEQQARQQLLHEQKQKNKLKIRKGRKDMKKQIFEQSNKNQEEVSIESESDMEKYLRESFELCQM